MVWIFIFLVECGLLSYMDRKVWKSFYTPLHFLMLPYLLVLLFTVCVAGNFGLSPFCYSSIFPWAAGLPFFALGGLCIGFLPGKGKPSGITAGGREPALQAFAQPPSWILPGITLAILLVFFVNLGIHIVSGDPGCGFGSDCFGQGLVENRWVSHLMVALMALLVVHVFAFDPSAFARGSGRKTASGLLLILILLSIFALFVHQVKNWVILPLLAGVIARILGRKTVLRGRLLAGVALGGILIFFSSYLLLYLCGEDMFPKGTAFKDQISSIMRLFVHYVTSGTMGFSLDMEQGFLEEADPAYLFTPFVNLWHLFSGEALLSAHNEEFVHTGLNYTNVRSLFGTLYVFSRPWLFYLFSFLGGALCYFFLRLFRAFPRPLPLLLLAWVCTLLFMGWFDSYIQLSNSFEIPFWILVFTGIDGFFRKRKLLLWK